MGTCLLFQDQICSDPPSWKEAWHKLQMSDIQCYTGWDTHLFTVPSPALTHKVLLGSSTVLIQLVAVSFPEGWQGEDDPPAPGQSRACHWSLSLFFGSPLCVETSCAFWTQADRFTLPEQKHQNPLFWIPMFRLPFPPMLYPPSMFL